jgi:bifunctional DNA-binding transcriptional regulator/antitoxin component of YhaV-PrlF toxin-antitoxin module
MKEVRLKIKKRAFPSHGRVRLNGSILTELGIQNGSSVNLINSATNTSVSVTVFTDSMVEKGQARVSEEDLKGVGLKEGDEVIIRVTPPLADRLKKSADEASQAVSEKTRKLGKKAQQTAEDAKAGAGKAYEGASKATKEGLKKIKKKVTEKDL